MVRRLLTHFWDYNFEQKVESQQGGKLVHTTHLMAFREVFDGSDVNTNDDAEIPRTKRRRVEYQPNEFPDFVINKSQELPKFSEIKHSLYVPAKFSSLFFIWLCFRKWKSHDQAVSTISGWLAKIRERRNPTKQPVKTTETCLLPMVSKVTEFSIIQQYMEYLQSLAASFNMLYANITLDVGTALNAFKFLWNGLEKYQNVVIHLGNFHFMKENFQVTYLRKNRLKILC